LAVFRKSQRKEGEKGVYIDKSLVPSLFSFSLTFPVGAGAAKGGAEILVLSFEGFLRDGTVRNFTFLKKWGSLQEI
jgi:hypothetical protein